MIHEDSATMNEKMKIFYYLISLSVLIRLLDNVKNFNLLFRISTY